MPAVSPKLAVGGVTQTPLGPWSNPVDPPLDIGGVTETGLGPWGNPVSPKLNVGGVTETGLHPAPFASHHVGLVWQANHG